MKVARDKPINSILRLDDNFAFLLGIDDEGSFVYEFRYFSLTVEAISNLANIVRITTRKTLPSAPIDVFVSARDSGGDLRVMINDILTSDARVKDAKRSNAANVITSTNSDITSRLNNASAKEIGRSLIPGKDDTGTHRPLSKTDGKGEPKGESPLSDILGTQRVISLVPVSTLRSKNMDPPVTQTMLFDHADKPTTSQAQTAAVNLIGRGIDPSTAGLKFNCINSTYKAVSGFGHTARVIGNMSNTQDAPAAARQQEMLVTSLYQTSNKEIKPLEDLDDKALVPIMSEVPKKEILNFKRVTINSKDVGLDDFYAIFELIDVNGVKLETLTRRVSHNQFVRNYNMPRTPPRVSVSPAQFSGKNVIEIEQLDVRATSVKLFRRTIKKASNIADDGASYEFVTELLLKKSDGLTKFIDIVNNSSTILYRCIPVGPGGLLGSEFTNAVAVAVKSKTAGRHSRSNAASLTSRIIQGGIELTVSNVPTSTVAVAVLRRDTTVNEETFSCLTISDPIRLVATNINTAVFIDTDVKKDHIYEYLCRLYFEDGTEVISTGNIIQLYLPLAIGIVDVEITDFQLIRNAQSVDVKFVVRSKLADDNLDQVQQALRKQGLVDLFQDDLKQERDRLQDLIAHSIVRIDLTTGVREDFGTFVGTTFVDSVVSQKNGVSELKEGHKYRYVIGTLIRKAETVFDRFVQNSIDVSTGKEYSYRPATFKHPITLSKGTIVSRESLARNHAEDDFAFGKIGNTREIDVMIDVPDTKIIDVNATRLDRRTASIKWNMAGRNKDIEHFIVMKELLGQAHIVGKVHNISPSKTFEFLDRIEPDDIGEVNYRIVPVMSDYSRGLSVSSNAMKVIDVRSVTSG